MKFLAGSSAEALAALTDAGHIASESMAHVRTVASFNLQPAVHRRFQLSLHRPTAADLRKARLQPIGLSVANALMLWMQVCDRRRNPKP